METLTPQPSSAFASGGTPFMSAADLASYAASIKSARALREREGLDRADKAQAELIKRLSETVELTPEKVQEITATLLHRLRVAAEQGRKELQVMRFPNALCTDGARAINNVEADWPETLTGRPRQAFEFWRDRLQPSGYGLRAMIVDWPHGMPGDVAFFLTWDAPQP
ncbi:hypothetical protein [Methylobacterium gregans]|uniref:Uncharacterized protein n=1 Tax=Methylobacterium gregans TaxID=374424 RepID=A0AA37HPD7_9HYPH|nr:hypothetical protein [Methylobacterium gregans]MDQ0519438.1 hypothetical protein [Methylobacterium gregans]GJD78532.1 hypothetical protein NBEOAGPD_1749 [Methylobacterium gregans]GLS52921.1 hypothetical protein GCM10007886_11040 [Methylobacterium gregans]